MKKLLVLTLFSVIFVAGISQAAFAPSLGAAAGYQTLDSRTANAGQARTDAVSAYQSAVNQPCTNQLSSNIGSQTLSPGVYCVSANTTLSGTLTLNQSGVYIFKLNGHLNVADNAQVTASNWQNVFWAISGNTVVHQGTHFAGTILSNNGDVTFENNAQINGRILSPNGIVRVNQPLIAINCSPCGEQVTIQPPVYPNTSVNPDVTTPQNGTVTVIKQIINNNGGTAQINDFALFVNGIRVTSGIPMPMSAGTYQVAETNLSSQSYYPPRFAGDCTTNGLITVTPGQNKTCIMINDDIGGTVLGEFYPNVPNTGGGHEGVLFLMLAVAGVLAGANVYKAVRSRA